MNYKKIYFDIINKAKIENENGKRSLGYFEKHQKINIFGQRSDRLPRKLRIYMKSRNVVFH